MTERRPGGSGTIRADGYIQVSNSVHPVAGVQGLAFVHRIVLYDELGPGIHRCYYCDVPVEWFVDLEVDHKDHDKVNNDPENLVPCCVGCNRSRWNTEKTGCPKQSEHGPYDKVYANGWRYCSKCKCEKEKRRRNKLRSA